MHIATVVLSVLLGAQFAYTGIINILGTGTARTNAPRVGISLRLRRFIGIAELAAAAGLLAGIVVKPLAIVTAAVVVLLMAVLHPAAITGLAAIALLTLTIVA
jgi:DoxX-like family